MWKKTNETDPQEIPPLVDTSAPASTTAPPATAQRETNMNPGSVIGSSITVNGDISGSEDLLVVGKLEGTVKFPKNDIHVGPTGQVKADLSALKISVEGRVSGDLRGSERVVIKQSGRVEGNIIAPRVVLEDGCQFKGSVEMNIDSNLAPDSVKSSGKTEAHAVTANVNQYNPKAKPRASSAS